MTALTPEVLDELAAKAEAATPGPWRSGWDTPHPDGDDMDSPVIYADVLDEGCAVVHGMWHDGPLTACTQPDAAHIAAASPDVVLALVAEVQQLREDVEFREGLQKRLEVKNKRLKALLECEAGRAAPEGWAHSFYDGLCWTQDPVWEPDSVLVERNPDGWYAWAGTMDEAGPYPYALEAIEAVEALLP